MDHSSLKEDQAETWRQELKQRPWWNTAYWSALHGQLSLLSNITQDSLPRVGTTHSEFIHINQENTLQTGQYGGGPFSIEVPFSQVDKQTN